jgi:hypothetical protein
MNTRYFIIALCMAVPTCLLGEENLASRVAHQTLNQNEPAVIKLGTRGITTLEFPSKIEAIDGYGFSVNPAPDGPDLFQISFNKGTNFLSLKAVREGVEGNLTVVLEGKVYSLFCRCVPDPSFVVIFDGGPGSAGANPRDVLAQNKSVSPARLLGFLDKIKAFPSLKTNAPEMFEGMDVAEPNSDSSVNGLSVTLRRVIRDNNLDCVGFEVELANKDNKDFLYDPESFGVRVGDDVYREEVSEAAGLVPAGKVQTAFFVVSGTSTSARNDLAVTNKFAVVLRQVTGEMDPHRKITTEWHEPPDTIPTAHLGWQEFSNPGASDSPTPIPQKAVKRSTGRRHGVKKTASGASTSNGAVGQPVQSAITGTTAKRPVQPAKAAKTPGPTTAAGQSVQSPNTGRVAKQ